MINAEKLDYAYGIIKIYILYYIMFMVEALISKIFRVINGYTNKHEYHAPY